MKIVTVTPAGRRRYLEILVRYLRRERSSIHEHRFWLNTRNAADVAYIESLAASDPTFFKVTRVPGVDNPAAEYDIGQICRFFPTCTDPDTIYIRLDDDICWIERGAIQRLAEFRERNQAPFLVMGNTINNGICNHIHQRLGLIPTDKGICTYHCMCPFSWLSREGGWIVHEAFLRHYRQNTLDHYKFREWRLYEHIRFSINVISWFGRDMATLTIDHDEEACLTERLPAQLQRPSTICGAALFAHFAYYSQRAHLEPLLLPTYQRLAGEECSAS